MDTPNALQGAFEATAMQGPLFRHPEGECGLNDAALFSLAYERMPVGIAQCAAITGQFIKLNQRCCDITGYSRQALGERAIRDIIHPGDHPAYHEAARRLFLGEERSSSIESRCRRKDGTAIWGAITLLPMWEPGDTPSSLIIVINDITAWKKEAEKRTSIEQRLAQAQRLEALGVLAGGVAHEFNNMLTPIIGYTELVAVSLPEDSPDRENLGVVRSSAWRASNLVRSLLAFSRQSSDELVPVPLAASVKEVVKMIRAMIPACIEIIPAVDEVGSVLAGAVHVQQILMNLCTNAYHAMRGNGGGRLDIALNRARLPEEDPRVRLAPGEYARLLVGDSGAGIEPSVLEHIFEPFFTTKQAHEGTGLGLSVVLGIVKRLGGAIEVDSTPGQGTRFTVYLPLTDSDFRSTAEHGKEGLPGGTERILIVDDESHIANLLLQILIRLGYEAVAVNCGSMAKALLSQERFDLLLTDLAMPGMSGIELIRKVAAPDGVKTILCTGHSDTVNEAAALAAGASAFIPKPYVTAELARTVRDVLDGNLPPLPLLNCWEFMQCAREAGGEKARELGVCPAYPDHGRRCASMPGTFCGGQVQGDGPQKRSSCMNCDFFRSRHYAREASA